MEFLEEKVYCRKCNGERKHIILKKLFREGKANIDNVLYNETSAIIECGGCETISFVRKVEGTCFNAPDGKTYNLGDKISQYPSKPKAMRPYLIDTEFRYHFMIPENIRDVFIQTVDTYNNGSNILCALGLRTIIESICIELNIKKGYKYDLQGNPYTEEGKKESIEGRIFGLYEKQLITWYHTLILQKVREIGNAATHQLVTPTSDEIYSAIEIVEKLIEDIFMLKVHSLLLE